jgi:acyl-CoA thioesterase I
MYDLHCMVRRVALTFAQSLGVGLTFAVAAQGVWAQTSGSPAPASVAAPASEPVDTSLSPECRVPGSQLYTLAPLKAVKRALKEQRAVKVLAIGSSSTAGVGASSPLASYPIRLEGELERLFPGVEVEVVNRGISGEVAAAAAERMKAAIAEVEPDLVIWQVGTNDALARVDLDTFAASVKDTIDWIVSHRIDVVLVDPQYTASLARDEHYTKVVKAIREAARRDRVPLVQRYESMRYLAGQASRSPGRSYLAKDQFHLNDLGYRCMAEHVARAITVSVLQPETAAPAATQSISGVQKPPN